MFEAESKTNLFYFFIWSFIFLNRQMMSSVTWSEPRQETAEPVKNTITQWKKSETLV